MSQIEVIVKPDGVVQWKEPLKMKTPQRAIVTFLDEEPAIAHHDQPRQLRLDWRGGLKELRDKYTSVEFQHEIFKEWDKNVSR